ncbi:maleylpyruvate isomerase family mycothiol-dependent enzyme [Pseudonocardia sulfidoxydans]|nr:maleylpyruvate isomerase family mycothiol-dependent enzyme [Pseudonocardia sulfidoxydans]
MTGVALDARPWAEAGTRMLLDDVADLSAADLDQGCRLPNWTRRHLLAHVASNAEAICRLLAWARTGVETPMYASPTQRAADIENGAARPDLRAWVRDTARELVYAASSLPDEAWPVEVVTAQGRTVPASEIWWMRARETCIHVVDLDAGTTFTDLPSPFLTTLLDDVAVWRSARPGPAITLVTPTTTHHIAGDGDPTTVSLPLASAAAWLVGRYPEPSLPGLPRWL